MTTAPGSTANLVIAFALFHLSLTTLYTVHTQFVKKTIYVVLYRIIKTEAVLRLCGDDSAF